MKKIFLLLFLLLFALPSYAKLVELYNDGNYSFQTDSIMFTDYQTEIFYTLYILPLSNTNKYYKTTITQFTTNKHMRISNMYALDKNGFYLHNDNTKNFIKTKIQNYSIPIGNNILKIFTKCNEDLMRLYCYPNK